MVIFRLVTVSKEMLKTASGTLLKTTVQVQRNSYTYRYICTEKPKKTKAFKTEKEKVRLYIVQKYVAYVKNYMSVLESRFPNAVKMYRVFSTGIGDFLKDLKRYIRLRVQVNKDKGLEKMTLEEIELYRKMPQDMWRIAPILILSAIPFGNYIIFPLAFLRPKALLCSHFWSIQQRAEFATQDLRDRLLNNKPVLRALQAKLESVPEGDTKKKWTKVLALLGSGLHPTWGDILQCNRLFLDGPYKLSELSFNHMGHLLKMHGRRKGIRRRSKLKYAAFLILEMDKAIVRQGGVETLSTESLRNACQIRGLNSMHLTNNDMKNWLQQWILVSQNVDKTNYSLILHCPIFFGYNHPQNWVLIY